MIKYITIKIKNNSTIFRALIVYSVLLIAILTAYFPVKDFDFVVYDDPLYVTQNYRVLKGLTLSNILWSLTATEAFNWHPLAWISHMIDIQIFGLNAGYHHLSNVSFHILNTVLLLIFLNAMTGEFWKNSFIVALFALHPLHAESVAWIAERKDVLSTFFCFLSLLSYSLYCKKKNRLQYLLSLLFFICALMAKPMVVTLPFVFLILDFWPLKRYPEKFSTKLFAYDIHGLKTMLIEKIPFFALSFLSCIITLAVQQSTIASIEKFPLIPRIANSFLSYIEYLAKTIFPFPLTVLYPYPQIFSIWKLTASLFVISTISFLAIRKLRTRPWIAVGWFWFLGTLVPVIGIVQVGVQGYADRYTYIPLIGLFISIAWQIPELVHDSKYKTVVLSTSATVFLCMLWVLTLFQVRHWENSITLFEHALKSTTENYVAHNNLGIALAAKDNFNEAITHYNKAIRIRPNYCDPLYNLGFASYKQGNIHEAIIHFQDGVTCNPEFAQAYYFLGNFYLKLNQIDNAINNYINALNINPGYVNVMINLSIALEFKGISDDSSALFNKARRIAPDFADAYRNKMVQYFRENVK